jgi:DNA-binding response OmpR family regulator
MAPATLQPLQEPARAPERAAHQPSLQRGTRILLVEDEPLTAEVFARALLRDGHRVDVVRDGLQALRRLQDRVPSLVVLDMSLPAVPGADVVRWLRGSGHDKVPIVVVSGCSAAGSDLAAADLQPGVWLEKPLKPRELVRVVREFLTERR